jgi:hypothetical protein
MRGWDNPGNHCVIEGLRGAASFESHSSLSSSGELDHGGPLNIA